MKHEKYIKTIRPVQCRLCGGSHGTIIKSGDEYEHSNGMDCERQRRLKEMEKKKEVITSDSKQ